MTGDDYLNVLNHARANGYAIPAVNCTMSPIINACLEAAKKADVDLTYDKMDIKDIKRLVRLRRRAKIKSNNALRAKK